MDLFPANFEALAQEGGNPALGGYPYRIKGSDLMRNFVHAALDADEEIIESATGQNGYTQRKLKIRAGTAVDQLMRWDGNQWLPLESPEDSGTYVLGSTGGVLSWGTGGNTREYIVAINGTLYREGFQCATQNAAGEQYPIEIP